MQYAGFWVRVLAYLIDYIILTVAQYAIMAVFGVGLFGLQELDPDGMQVFTNTGLTAIIVLTTIGGILYFVLLESSSKQATPGKMALGLVVTDSDGNRIGVWRALGRYFAKFLSAIIFLVGFIMVAFTPRKRGLHDILASTLVVKGKPGTVGVDTAVFE